MQLQYEQEVQLRCLEMALSIARGAGKGADLEFVAETQTWLYNHVVIPPELPKSALFGDKDKARTDKTR